MKPCPFCGEQIQDAAVKCRFCFEWLDPTRRPAWSEAGPPADAGGALPDAGSPPAGRWQPTPEVERWNSPGTIIMGSDVTADAAGLPEVHEPHDRTSPGVPLPSLRSGGTAPGDGSSHFDRLRHSARGVGDRLGAPPSADELPPLPAPPVANEPDDSMSPGDLRAGPQVVRIPTPMSSPTRWRGQPDPDEPQTMRGWTKPVAGAGDGDPQASDVDRPTRVGEPFPTASSTDAAPVEPSPRPTADRRADIAREPQPTSDPVVHGDVPVPAASDVAVAVDETERVATVPPPQRAPVDAFEAAFFGDDLDDDDDDDDAEMSAGDLSALAAPRRRPPWFVPAGIGSLAVVAYIFFGGPLPGFVRGEHADSDAAESSTGTDEKPGAPAATPEPPKAEPEPEPEPPPPPPKPVVVNVADEDLPKLDEARDLYKRRKLEQTREILDGLLVKYPRASDVLVLLAQVQLEQGQSDDAFATASTCVEVDDDAADCWLTVAVLRQAKEDVPGAIIAWERYLALSPDGAYANDADRELKRLRAKAG